jgi:predicted O-methyltransferase YrrM
MYTPLQLSFKYLRHYLTASSGRGHGVHSPFVFDLITKVINDKQYYPEYDQIENLRQELRKDTTSLTIEDFGAGSSFDKTDQRTVASIAKNAAKTKKLGQLLFRMVKRYQPAMILELGTSLGLTTSYLAAANSLAKVVTLEGAPAVATMAESNFKLLNLSNIQLVKGNFDDTLMPTIQKIPSTDFVFIDGNHQQDPTEKYFRQLLSKTHNDSILIFDDIHWSRGMESAWDTIRKHPSVRCSIDLFFIGIVLFRQEFREKQHFVLRF